MKARWLGVYAEPWTPEDLELVEAPADPITMLQIAAGVEPGTPVAAHIRAVVDKEPEDDPRLAPGVFLVTPSGKTVCLAGGGSEDWSARPAGATLQAGLLMESGTYHVEIRPVRLPDRAALAAASNDPVAFMRETAKYSQPVGDRTLARVPFEVTRDP